MNLLKNIISGSSLSKPVDLSVLKTDMHSHLIPGIDDGSKSMEESVDLIRKLADLGFKKLIITPHIMGDYFKNTPEIILSGLESLRFAVKNAGMSIELEAAAEYLIDDGFEEKLKSGKLLTFGNNYLLIELSFFAEHPNLSSLLFDLQIAGYKVVLAHPERYSYWNDDFKKYEELKNRNIFLQLNIVSLSGFYSEQSKKMAEKLIDKKMIDFLGTDSHNFDYIKGVEESLFEKSLNKVLTTNNILNSTL